MCFKFNTKNQFLNFFRAQTTILNNEQEIEKFKTLYEELTTELAESRKKEDEMLQFTKSVTEKNVALQSKFSSLEAMVRNFFLSLHFADWIFDVVFYKCNNFN